MQVNEATGEVSVTLAGVEFRLHGTLPRLAAFEAACGVSGFGAIQLLLERGSPKAILQGLRCLCPPDQAKAIDGLVYGRIAGDAQKAIFAALAAALPEAEPGNAGAPAGTT